MTVKNIFFIIGIVFTTIAPLYIGFKYENIEMSGMAFLCGAFLTFVVRLGDIAELSLGPVKAKMRETIAEANATIDQLHKIAANSAKVTLTDLMGGNFIGAVALEKRLDLHDQLIDSLKEIGVSDVLVADADEMWKRGIGLIYHRKIGEILSREEASKAESSKARDKVYKEFQSLMNFKKWQAPSPEEIEGFLTLKGCLTAEMREWTDDYRHFRKTGEIRRREMFAEQKL
jgi:hypothetical protein